MKKSSVINNDTSYVTAQQLASLLLAAAGLGVGGRALVEPIWATQRHRAERTGLKPRYSLPGLKRLELKEEEDVEKTAAEESIFTRTRDALANVLWKSPLFSKGKSWFGGRDATGFVDNPAAIGIGVPLVAATFGGGWGVTNQLIKGKRKRQEEQEIATMKQDYEALLGKITQIARQKQGSTLDELAEFSIKNASFWDWINPKSWYDTAPQWGGTAVGTLVAAALVVAYGAGKFTYDKNLQTKQHEVFDEARRLRDLRLQHGEGVPLHIDYEGDNV